MAFDALHASPDRFSFSDALILTAWMQGAIEQRTAYQHLLD